MAETSDRCLGMGQPIPRRDFLNGMAVAIGAGFGLGCSRGGEDQAPEKAPGYYPPALTGLRGSTDAAYENAHAVRDSSFWKRAGAPIPTEETYDLAVVGAGISGLTAAYAFRKQLGPAARILVLDNHDDFGGHARRNEFTVGNRMLIGYGGTFSIDSPAPYSAVAKALIAELGIDVARWSKVVDPSVYAAYNLGRAVLFDRETFGADALVRFSVREGDPSADAAMWQAFRAAAPLADAAKDDLERLYAAATDYMPGLSSEAKKAKLARMSYARFLTDVVRAHPQVASFFQARVHDLYGLGIDAVPAQDAWGIGLPGFAGLGLDASIGRGMNHDAIRHPEGGDAYFFHFPDGNASIARLIVRRLVRDAIPGASADDIVTARCNYARLDEAGSPVRIRLNSTVVRVGHVGNPATAREVEVAYMRGGKLRSVRAGRCILACWHAMVPFICPELPSAQRLDLATATKVPILYTNVLLRDWHAFVKAGTNAIHSPGGFHSTMSLDMPVSLGNYHCPRAPDEPIVVHLARTPCRPGLPAREQHRLGREELFAMPFEEIERRTRDQFARALGPSGFDPARDIAAITVNRWAHGYAYQYNSLYDDFWFEGRETPCERARKPFGRLALANADASAYSYTDAAIDNALRAVREVTTLP
jgi:spermidine dehydrogenase